MYAIAEKSARGYVWLRWVYCERARVQERKHFLRQILFWYDLASGQKCVQTERWQRWIHLSDLLSPVNETRGKVLTSYIGEVNVPMYIFGDDVKVWGATATILSEMKELILTALKE